MGFKIRERYTDAINITNTPQWGYSNTSGLLGIRKPPDRVRCKDGFLETPVAQAIVFQSSAFCSVADYNSALTSRAPSTIARILPNATSRGRYFIPQSGATTMRSGLT
jgi:hypothetical protein